MLRKLLINILTIASILLAMASIVAHWHPLYFGGVLNQKRNTIELVNGKFTWFYEAERSNISPCTMWTSSDHFLPGGYGYRTTSDDSTLVRVPGMWLEWYRQKAGYRRFYVRMDLFTLAMLTILYPMIHLATVRIRRSVRRRRGQCLSCAYSLRGNDSGICPECGGEIISISTATDSAE